MLAKLAENVQVCENDKDASRKNRGFPLAGNGEKAVRMQERKKMWGISFAMAGLVLVGLSLGFLPWPHSLPSVSRPLCRSLQESSLPLADPTIDAARSSMPSAQRHLRLETSELVAEGAAELLSTPWEDRAYPSLLKELLAETPRPVALPGSGPARGVPELLAASARISARPEHEKKPSGALFCPGIAEFTVLPRNQLEPGFAGKTMVERSLRYHDTVRRLAFRYGLDPALVLAVMQVESSFDPNQVSVRSAHGLMQIVPGTAGREVRRWLGEGGEPSSGELLNPEQNIRYGVIYLHLLHSAHLGGIKDPLSREYCAIASYNGGSNMVLRQFGASREEAFKAINAMTAEEVYNKLLESLPARETRSFVRKVLAARHIYTAVVDKNPAQSEG